MELQVIQSKIYEIRGQKVMLDKDLAELYQVEVRTLNQAVKRNMRRFPPDFMFQLTIEEWNILKSQFVISSWGGIRKLPNAFTEQGLAMLSGILNSDIAINVNISIMRAFVAIRNGLASVSSSQELEDLKQRIKILEEGAEDTIASINDLSEDTRRELDDIYLALSQLADRQKQITHNTTPRKPIGFAHYKNKEE